MVQDLRESRRWHRCPHVNQLVGRTGFARPFIFAILKAEAKQSSILFRLDRESPGRLGAIPAISFPSRVLLSKPSQTLLTRCAVTCTDGCPLAKAGLPLSHTHCGEGALPLTCACEIEGNG
jgi:hypothetical protein